MAKRRQIIEIFMPTLGLKSDVPANIMDVRSSPEGQDSKVYYGYTQKEYGTSLYNTGNTGVGASPSLIFDARFPGSNVLQVVNATGVYKYTSGADSFISDGQIFTSTYTDFWRGVMHNDHFIYTNGNENIQIKTTVAGTGTTMNSAVATNTYKAWDVQSVRDHLVLYHVFENGSEYFKRVRWTKKGALTPSGTNDFSTGTAGAIDLQDAEGEIKGGAPLGPGVVAVFAERSIHIQFWVGGGDVYRFEKMVSGIGSPSRRGFVSFEGVVYFFSHNNIYAYYGGSDVRPIGEPIRRKLYAELDESYLNQVWVEFDSTEKELLVHIPTGDNADGKTDTTYVYRITDNAWSRLKRNYTASGFSTRRSGLTIGELVGNIGAQNFTFGSAKVQQDSELRLYGDLTGRIVQEDISLYSISESGTSKPQTFIYQTPDLSAGGKVDPLDNRVVEFSTVDKLWKQYTVELKGEGSANISYSTDGGASFVSFDESPVTMVASGTFHTLGISERSREIRVQIKNTGTNDSIAVGYQKMEFVPGSEQEDL